MKKQFNIESLKAEGMKKKKEFVSTIKERCELILFNFRKPVRRQKYEKTDYIIYSCKLIKVNGVSVDFGKHLIQIPLKTAWLQLYGYLENLKSLDKKNLHLFVIKKNNHHYIWNCPELDTCPNT